MATLHLLPIHLGSAASRLGELGRRVGRLLGLDARVATPRFDPESAFDRGRSQYNSTRLLARILEEPYEEGDRLLGIAGVDLFVPVLTYVFGEAQLEGRAAVVSTFRLDDAIYGLPPNPARLFERLEKEAVHELGHTFGLLHCEGLECVMRSSTYVEEIDLKSARFCPRCRAAADRG